MAISRLFASDRSRDADGPAAAGRRLRSLLTGVGQALGPSELRLVLRALLPYAVFGVLWVTLADRVAALVAPGPVGLAVWEEYKPWIFVALSLFLIYILVRTEQVARVRSERKFAAAFATTPDPMAILRLDDGMVVEVNDGFIEQLGYEKSELVGRQRLETGVWADPPSAAKFWDALRETGRLRNFETEFRARDGTLRTVLLSARVVPIDRTVYVVAAAKDITEHRAFEARLERQAVRDSLTDLPNRTLLLDRLRRELARARRREMRVAVLSVDVDRFKVINESLGYASGDRLLIEIAGRLTGSIRQEDTVAREAGTVARIGADEFTVVLGEVSAVPDAMAVVDRLRERLAEPFVLDGKKVTITVATGVVVSPEGAAQSEELLRQAGIAMRRAKAKGLGNVHVFDPGVDAREGQRLRLENDLREAVEGEELELRFQPIVALESGRLAGFESLVRWRHRELGLLSPLDFIPLAEESGLIIPVGRWVLREACQQGSLWGERWARRFPERPPLTMAVNLSASELQQSGVARRVEETLRETDMRPGCLEFEITESLLAHQHGALRSLKRLDVRLLVDDFGTGYSALSYLSRLPVDAIKIDRSFVAEFGQNPEVTGIVKAVIAMADTLDLEVVAEGIETEAQLALLRRAGCDYGQGYHFARPLRRRDAAALIEQDRVW